MLKCTNVEFDIFSAFPHLAAIKRAFALLAAIKSAFAHLAAIK